jgi:hypothetical protein
MLLSAGRLGDEIPGTLHTTPLCVTSMRSIEIFLERRALSTSKNLQSALVASSGHQMRRPEIGFDKRT